MKLFSLFLFLSSFATADVSCWGIDQFAGASIYLYPGIDQYGKRIPVAEFNGSKGESDFMKCNTQYTYCIGKKYTFTWSVYDARIGSPHGLIAVMKCNNHR